MHSHIYSENTYPLPKMLLFCSRYIYLRETFVLGMLSTGPFLPVPTQAGRPRWLQPIFSDFFWRNFTSLCSVCPLVEGFWDEKKQGKKQSGRGGSLWRPKWNPQPDFEPSKLEKSFWMNGMNAIHFIVSYSSLQVFIVPL